MAKKKYKYFRNLDMDKAYIKFVKIRERSNPFKGMTTMEILKEIRKR